MKFQVHLAALALATFIPLAAQAPKGWKVRIDPRPRGSVLSSRRPHLEQEHNSPSDLLHETPKGNPDACILEGVPLEEWTVRPISG